MKLLASFFVFLLFLLLAPCLVGGELYGTLALEDGLPQEGTVIELRSQNGETVVAEAKTDRSGRYSLLFEGFRGKLLLQVTVLETVYQLPVIAFETASQYDLVIAPDPDQSGELSLQRH